METPKKTLIVSSKPKAISEAKTRTDLKNPPPIPQSSPPTLQSKCNMKIVVNKPETIAIKISTPNLKTLPNCYVNNNAASTSELLNTRFARKNLPQKNILIDFENRTRSLSASPRSFSEKIHNNNNINVGCSFLGKGLFNGTAGPANQLNFKKLR